MEGYAINHAIATVALTAAILAEGCQSAADIPVTPTATKLCYEQRQYRVFIPTPHEICPDPPRMFEEFFLHGRDFNERHRDEPPAVREQAFFDEFGGLSICREVWAEKWTTVTCDNRVCTCDSSGCSGQWTCDHGSIPPGKLPEDSGLPFSRLGDPIFIGCSGGSCLLDEPDTGGTGPGHEGPDIE